MLKSALPNFKLSKTEESVAETKFFTASHVRKRKLDEMARKQDAMTLKLQLVMDKWDLRHSWEYWEDFEEGSPGAKLALQTQRSFSKESPYRLKTRQQK